MAKKTVDISAGVEEAANNIKSMWGKAKNVIVNAMDQNDDGAFDLKDVSVIAETIGKAAQSTAHTMKSSVEEKSREIERKMLQPIFVEDLDDADFLITKLVRITEIDKKSVRIVRCALDQ